MRRAGIFLAPRRAWDYNLGLCWQTLNGLINFSWGTPQSRCTGPIFPRTLWPQIRNTLANDDDPRERE